jgi:cyclohexyl-isocyanide hydratase
MISAHLRIGALLFEGIDQIDLTGPFEVLSRLPDSEYSIYAKTASPVRDINGLKLTPDATLAEAPQLDVLHVPGGPGQEALMDDSEVLGWLNKQAAGGSRVFSVCTGALLLGAAGCSRAATPPPTGPVWICCLTSAPPPSMSGSSRTGT